MKLESGHVIRVEGKEGTVVYTTRKNEKDYALVSYEEGNKMSLKVFEVKIDNNKILVSEEKDEKLVSDILVDFTKANTVLGDE